MICHQLDEGFKTVGCHVYALRFRVTLVKYNIRVVSTYELALDAIKRQSSEILIHHKLFNFGEPIEFAAGASLEFSPGLCGMRNARQTEYEP